MSDDTDDIIDIVTDQIASTASPEARSPPIVHESRRRYPSQHDGMHIDTNRRNEEKIVPRRSSTSANVSDSTISSQRSRLEKAKSYLESRYKQDASLGAQDASHVIPEEYSDQQRIRDESSTQSIKGTSDQEVSHGIALSPGEHPKALPGMRAWTALVKKKPSSSQEETYELSKQEPILPAKQSILQLKERLKSRMQNMAKNNQRLDKSYDHSPYIPHIAISPALSATSVASFVGEPETTSEVNVSRKEWMKEFISTFGLMRSYGGPNVFHSGSLLTGYMDGSQGASKSSFDFRSKDTSPPFVFVPLSPNPLVSLPTVYKRQPIYQRYDTMTISSKYEEPLQAIINTRFMSLFPPMVLEKNPELVELKDRWDSLCKREIKDACEIIGKADHVVPSIEELKTRMNYLINETAPAMAMNQFRYTEDINDAFRRLATAHERIGEVSGRLHQLSLIDRENEATWNTEAGRATGIGGTFSRNISRFLSQDTLYLILSWILALLLKLLWLLASAKRILLNYMQKFVPRSSQDSVQRDTIDTSDREHGSSPFDEKGERYTSGHNRNTSHHQLSSARRMHRRQLS